MSITSLKTPPHGVVPKYLYDETIAVLANQNGGINLAYYHKFRFKALKRAIKEYSIKGLPINVLWVVEYNDLTEFFKLIKKK